MTFTTETTSRSARTWASSRATGHTGTSYLVSRKDGAEAVAWSSHFATSPSTTLYRKAKAGRITSITCNYSAGRATLLRATAITPIWWQRSASEGFFD